MISSTSVAAMIFSLAVAVLVPLGACFYFTLKGKTSWRAVAAGALGYLVGEVLIRGRVVDIIAASSEGFANMMSRPFIFSLFTGVTSGIMVALCVYIACFAILRRPFDHKNALGVGLGAGGVFTLVSLGVDSLVRLIVALNYNAGRLEAVAEKLGTGEVTRILEQFSQTSNLELILASLVFVFAIMAMIAAACLWVYGLRARSHIFILWGALVWAFFRTITVHLGFFTSWLALLFALFFGLLCRMFYDLVRGVYDQTPEASYARAKASGKKDISVTGGSHKKKKKKKKK